MNEQVYIVHIVIILIINKQCKNWKGDKAGRVNKFAETRLFHLMRTLKLTTSRFPQYGILGATSISFSSPNDTETVGGWGSAPDPAGGAYDAPQTP